MKYGCGSANGSVSIRYGNSEDTAKLLSLERAVFPDAALSIKVLVRLLEGTKPRVLVAEMDECVVGAAIVLWRFRRVARLYSLAVAPRYSGRGIGRMLLAAAERMAVAGGCQSMKLEVREDNDRAIRLYRGVGYCQSGRLSAFYEDGCDALTFARPLC